MIFDKIFKKNKTKDNPEAAENALLNADLPPAGDPMVGEEEAGWDEYPDEEEQSASEPSIMPDDVDGEPSAEEPKPAESELDKQLNQMLEADRQADEGFNPHLNKGLVQKTSVFDGSLKEEDNLNPELQWETYGKKKEKAAPLKSPDSENPKGLKQKIGSMSVRKLLISAGIIIFALLGIGLGAVLIARSVITSQAKKEDISRFMPITQPTGVTNDSNYIFINQTLDFNGTSFTLSKISAGSLNTMVYFVRPPDVERYSYSLVDQNQNLYMRRLYGHSAAGTDAALEFDPLRINVVFLTLTIHDNETGEEAAFYFRFTEMPAFVPADYFNSPTPVMPPDDNNTASPIQIERVIVSNTGTEVYYSLNDAGGSAIRFSESSGRPFIQMKQGNHFIRPISDAPEETRFGNQQLAIGKMVFDPLQYTDRDIDLLFNDLFYTYQIQRRSVDMAALLDYENNEPQQIFTGKQKLVLEAMGIQGKNIILVLHGEDEDGERIQTLVDAKITVAAESGEYVIAGECFSGDGGSDVVFDLAENDIYDSIHGTPIEKYTVTLNSVEYNIPQLEVPIDLAATEEVPEKWIGTAVSFAEEAFSRRLAHKSNLLELSEVTGFADDLMKDRTLMRYYQPAGMDEMPKYSAQVVSGAMLPDNIFAGVVEEEWMLGAGEDLTVLHTTHRIVCERDGNRWVITGDEIVNDN